MKEISPEKQVEALQASLKEVGDELRTYAEASEKELKRHASLSEETKASVDELLAMQTEVQARLQEAEQRLVSMNSFGAPDRPRTAGEMLAQSDEMQAFGGSSRRGTVQVDVGSFQNAITHTITGGDLQQPQRVPGITPLGQRRVFVRDLIPFTNTGSNSVEFIRETGFTNNANTVAENPSSEKPESELTQELASASVATIAHWINASKQVLDDVSMLQGYIDGRLTYGLRVKEDAQLLKGSGTGNDIDGIYTQASAYANPGVTVTNETNIDRLRLAMLQVSLAEYETSAIVLHPLDWAAIELTKDSQNRYIFGSPQQSITPMLWGMPVAATQALNIGEFITGAFSMGAQGWDRMSATVMVSTENKDNFVKNMVTILAEERLALTVYRPESFVKGTFASVSSSGA